MKEEAEKEVANEKGRQQNTSVKRSNALNTKTLENIEKRN